MAKKRNIFGEYEKKKTISSGIKILVFLVNLNKVWVEVIFKSIILNQQNNTSIIFCLHKIYFEIMALD